MYRPPRMWTGNTVRKVQRTVEIRPERDEREEYRHKHAVRRNQEKALYMNGPYVLALTIAALIALVLCMNYLHKQASITTRINHIEDLELKLENLKSENDALQTRMTRMWIWIMYIKWRPKSSAWYMQIRIRFFYMTRRKASM